MALFYLVVLAFYQNGCKGVTLNSGSTLASILPQGTDGKSVPTTVSPSTTPLSITTTPPVSLPTILPAIPPAKAPTTCFGNCSSGFVVKANQVLPQPYTPLGVNLWPGNSVDLKVVKDLKIKGVRFSIGPNWQSITLNCSGNKCPPLGASVSDYYNNFIATNIGSSGIQSLGQALGQGPSGLNIPNIVLTQFQFPVQFTQQPWVSYCEYSSGAGRCLLDSAYVQDLANYYTALILYLKNSGLNPNYVEFVNEPDQQYEDLFMGASDYKNFVDKAQLAFNQAGITTKIMGPGLANMKAEVDNNYIGQFNNSSPISAWSLHEYDLAHGLVNGLYGSNSLDALVQQLSNKANNVKNGLPFFITEFAGSITTTNQNSHVSGAYVTDLMKQIAVFYGRQLSQFFVWEAADQSWEGTSYGLVNTTGNPYPSYYLIYALNYPFSLNTYNYIQASTTNSSVMSALFYGQNGTQKSITAVIWNQTSSAVTLSIDFSQIVNQFPNGVSFTQGYDLNPGDTRVNPLSAGQSSIQGITIQPSHLVTLELMGL